MPLPAAVSRRPARPRSTSRPLLALLLTCLLALLTSTRAEAKQDPWAKTLERVSRAVMALEVSATRSLDTEAASSVSGTGFVVDKERGILLTNRHMVFVGPVRAKGITLNHEVVTLHPIYRDPVHDFGFYQFDPAEVKYMELAELPLAPDAAHVGVEIRVVGNDAGEKLSILDGTLARLDRPAPDYGATNYNDFNTFYYQAATSTSGGSSGSPVVDIKGRVLALNAGGSRSAASSYYLPVLRAAEALAHIRNGEPIPRGTLQATYRYESYDELDRLGLQDATERDYRRARPAATGMLVVRDVVPGGPADGRLLAGDIIVRLGDLPIDGFEIMETLLNGHVGQAMTLHVERGGVPIDVSLTVDDLHSLSPSRYVEFSQGILQETSLQLARNNNVPAKGVILVEPGYTFRRARVWMYSQIISLNEHVIENLDDLAAALAALPDGDVARLRYRDLDNPHQERITTITIDHRWSPARDCQRNDNTGLWDCSDIPAPPPADAAPATPPSATFEQVRDPVAAILAPSLCVVRFTIPYRTEGVEGWSYIGSGLVVDAERGLVVTDRGTVPIFLGDVELTFAGSVRIPAHVAALHPIHNIAILSYDPADLGDVPVKTARLAPEVSMDAGVDVMQVGLTSSQRVVSQKTSISRVDFIGNAKHTPPSFREYNSEVYKVTDSASSIGGVLADETGGVVALWAFNANGEDSGWFLGLPVEYLVDAIEPLRRGEELTIHDLGVEVCPISLAAAREQGTPDEWISRLESADPERRQAINVERVAPSADAARLLQGGDILLSLEGQPLTRPRQMETLLRDAGDTVRVLRLRDGELQEVELTPLTLNGHGVDRLVSFAGALLHEPHWQVALQYDLEPGGLYVSWYWYGAPAAMYGLRAATLVRAINDVPVSNLDEFLAQVRNVGDEQSVRLRVENLKGVTDVSTLVTDLVYWPTATVEHLDEGWTWVPVVPTQD